VAAFIAVPTCAAAWRWASVPLLWVEHWQPLTITAGPRVDIIPIHPATRLLRRPLRRRRERGSSKVVCALSEICGRSTLIRGIWR
jgi:hypothetical protein